MTISGRTRILAALGAALALTLSGPAYAGGGTAPKVVSKPVVGECRSLTLTEALAKTNTTPPVDCGQPHNTRVIAVRNLPGGATYDDLTKAQLFAAVDKICDPALYAATSKSFLVLDRTSYSFVWFEPTKQEKTDGARWVRCDLTLVHGHTYGDLPTDAVPALKGSHVPNRAKRCLTGKQFIITTCTASHNYRATGSFMVASKTFPGTKKMIRIGNARCPEYVSSRTFRFSWKSKQTYNKHHDHVMVCFTKTSH